MVAAASASDDPAYAAGPIQKAQRGFVNTVFGWTEFFKRITEKTQEAKNPFADMLIGAWEGTCKAFARTASGASELVTFPIGRYDKPGILPDMPVREK
jgi:putative exosortase-associated protein (TIGR04073 family)